jgi:hypothetical protein
MIIDAHLSGAIYAEKIYAKELRKSARGDRTALNNLTGKPASGQVTQCHFSKS